MPRFPGFQDRTDLFPALQGLSIRTYAASWRDVNDDGASDLYVNHHSEGRPMLFLSSGRDSYDFQLLPDDNKDRHAAAWLDLDGDGRQELLELVGGGFGLGVDPQRSSNTLRALEEGRLTTVDARGLEHPLSRGRQPLALDLDRDGDLDLLHGSLGRPDGSAPAGVFLQSKDGRFAIAERAMRFDPESLTHFALGRFWSDDAVDILAKRRSELLLLEEKRGRLAIEETLGVGRAGSDFVVADFDNDLVSDIWVARVRDSSNFTRFNAKEGNLHFVAERGGGPSFAWLDGEGDLVLDFLRKSAFPPARLIVGRAGEEVEWGQVDLDRSDPSLRGRPRELDAATDSVIGIWRDAAAGVWRLESSVAARFSVEVRVKAKGLLHRARTDGEERQADARDIVFFGRGDGTFDSEFIKPLKSLRSAAVGDFDNDGDVDVFALAATVAGEVRDGFYVNRGDGKFDWLAGRRYAPGPKDGYADAVSVADRDRDGWLDLMTTSGRFESPERLGGTYRFQENQGGKNGWLLVDLQAVGGDASTLGSIVFAKSKTIEQMRVQSDGARGRIQDDPILHFGMGSDPRADLQVVWRDGAKTVAEGVRARSLVEVWRGGPSGDRKIGGDDVDVLDGRGGSDEVSGGGLHDVLHGRHGNDRLYGGIGRDRLHGGNGDDRLHGGPNADELRGGRMRDALFGGLGDDALFGEKAADVLRGGRGDDRLVGGRGPDTFEFRPGDGRDRIVDFMPGSDAVRMMQGATTFDDLDFRTRKRALEVEYGDDGDILLLIGIRRQQLDADDFLFG